MQFVTELATRLSTLEYRDLPATTVEHAKMALASSIAAVALGQGTPPVAIITELARRRGGAAQSRLWFGDGAQMPLADAIRINTMAADESMADDSALFNGSHLGSATAAAALGAADAAGATGEQVITAVVAGYEAAVRLGYADRQLRARRHAHVSGLNAFGCAIAVCSVLRSTAEAMAHALAIAATGANGVDAVSTNHARPYQAGFSALTGVEAALAAHAGFRVDPHLLSRYLDGPEDAEPPYVFGSSPWAIDNELIIKLRPGAFLFSSAVDAALHLARGERTATEDIERVRVRGQAFRREDAANRPAPSGSLAYYVASALALGTFDWDHFTGDALGLPEVERLVRLVDIEPTAREDSPGRWAWAAEVVVTRTDGRSVSAVVDLPPGAIPRGVEWAELDAKLSALLSRRGICADRIDAIRAAVRELDRAPDAREVTALLA